MKQKVLAIGAHPDDIEFMMAGTLLSLAHSGYEPHVFVVGSGSCGSMVTNREDTVRIRLAEAENAAQVMMSQFHPPIADDLEILYELPLLRRVAALIRKVQPDIILTHSLEEYMEDHINTCRLAVTASFSRGMPNFQTDPPMKAYNKDIVIYHCLPYGLCDQFGKKISPDLYIDIKEVIEVKAEALARHESQKRWLDESQGLDSYIQTMKGMGREVGTMSGRFEFAEGWRFHNALGFCPGGSNPIKAALGEGCHCA